MYFGPTEVSIDTCRALRQDASYSHCDHHTLFSTHVYGEAHWVGPVYPSPPHCPHCGTVPEVLVEVGLAVVVTVDRVVGGGVELDVVDVGLDPPEAGAAISLTTSASKPVLAYNWLISHIMTPPKLGYDLLDAIASARSVPST